MKGHLIKRGRCWYAVLELPRVDGKRRQKWQKLPGNKKQAEAELAKLIHQIETGQFALPSSITVAAYLEHWLEIAIRPKKAALTIQLYESVIRRHITPRLGTVLLSRLTAYQLQKYFAELAKEGRRGGGGLSEKSLKAHYAILRAALRQAVIWQYLNVSPLAQVEAPNPEQKDVQPLTLVQVRKLLEHAADTPLLGPILFGVCYGMRIGEVLGLRWQDVDTDAGQVHVRQNLVWPGRMGPLFTKPKGRRARTYPLLDPVRLFLRARKIDPAEPLIFPAPERGPWRSDTVRQGYYRLLKECDLPRVRFHDLRHSNSALLLSAGIPMFIVSRWLGHRSESITDGVYGHLLPGDKERAGAAMENLLAKVLPGTRAPRKILRVSKRLAKREFPGTNPPV